MLSGPITAGSLTQPSQRSEASAGVTLRNSNRSVFNRTGRPIPRIIGNILDEHPAYGVAVDLPTGIMRQVGGKEPALRNGFAAETRFAPGAQTFGAFTH